MISIQIADTISLPVEIDILRNAADETIRFLKDPSDTHVTIVFTDDEQVHKLNLQFRGVDSTTDVLAFPVGQVDPDTNALYLGDVMISVPQARAGSKNNQTTISDELQLLVVHGVLHLLGFDHIEDDDRVTMQTAQDEILTRLGCTALLPTML
jgi:probable rRNA maturation factor